MKNFVKTSFVLVSTLVFSLSAAIAAPTASPKGLEGSCTQLDFGKIAKPTVRNFTVYNRSSTPVVIISAATDCNCTKVDYSPRPIKSGDSTVIRVSYTPKDKGVFYKSVTLRNSTNTDLKFIVRGTVI
ncbi:MAG: DUF1573 domain-containing protein [Mucinivorans sp.]